MDSINFRNDVTPPAFAEPSNKTSESNDFAKEFASTSDSVTSPESPSASNRSRTSFLYGSASQKAPTTSSRSDGFSPLHVACDNGNIDTVQALLKSHADVNVTNKDGETPLHLACHKDRTDIITDIIQAHH